MAARSATGCDLATAALLSACIFFEVAFKAPGSHLPGLSFCVTPPARRRRRDGRSFARQTPNSRATTAAGTSVSGSGSTSNGRLASAFLYASKWERQKNIRPLRVTGEGNL